MKAILHIGVLALCVVASSCYADEVSDWLEKMGSALREQNYEGTFTYMRGSQFETIRVTAYGKYNHLSVHFFSFQT